MGPAQAPGPEGRDQGRGQKASGACPVHRAQSPQLHSIRCPLSGALATSDQRGSSGPVGEGGGCPARLRSLWEPLKLGVTPRSVQLARSITAARWAPAECVRR